MSKMIDAAYIRMNEFHQMAVEMLLARRREDGQMKVTKADIFRDGIRELLRKEGIKVSDVNAAMRANRVSSPQTM